MLNPPRTTRISAAAPGVIVARFSILTLISVSLTLAACTQRSADQQVAAAKVSLEKGDHRSAAIELKDALQREPNMKEARLLLGRALLRGGDANGAQIELRKSLEFGASPAEVVPMIASVMLLTGELDRLIAEHADTDLRDPKAQGELKSLLANAYGLKGKWPQAKAAAEEALRVDPQNHAAELILVRVSASAGDRQGALDALERMLQARPNLATALLLKAELLGGFGRPVPEVREAFAAVLKAEPKNISALSSLMSLQLLEQQVDGARATLEQLRQAHPNNVLTVYSGVLFASHTGDIAKAYEQSQQLVKLLPDHGRALQLAGAVAYQKGSFLEASAHFGKALLKAENADLVRTMLARTFMRLGEPNRALIALRPLLERQPLSSDAGLVAAEAYMQLGDMRAAQQLFERAAKSNPNDVRARTALVMSQPGDAQATDEALRKIGAQDQGTIADMALIAHRITKRQLPEALQAIDALERKQPGQPLAEMLRGRVELLRGDKVKARKHFESAQVINVAYVPAAAALASMDLEAGRRDDAIGRFQKAADSQQGSLEAEMAIIGLRAESGIKLNELIELIGQTVKRHPRDPQPRLALISARLDAGQVKESLTEAQEGAAAFPLEPAFFDLLARAQQLAGDQNQALAAATKMASLQPNSPMPYVRMADLSLAAGDLQAGAAHLQRALSLRRDFLPAQRNLQIVYLQLGKQAEARALAQTVQKQRPNDPAGWLMSGDLERQLGRHEAAVQAFRAALKLSRTADVAMRLHGALHLAGAGEEAQRFEQAWLAEYSRDHVFRTYLAERAMQKGEPAIAERYFEEVIKLTPDNVAALNNLAWLQHEARRPEALATIERALRLRPQASALLDTLASIQAASGKLEEALKTQLKAVDNDPNNALHRFHLAEYLVKSGKTDAAKAELAKLAALGTRFAKHAEVKAMQARL